jgi:hypothetical protein
MLIQSQPRHLAKLRRLAVLLATTSLTFALASPARTQPAPPPGTDQQGAEQAGEPDTNPPALAGRVANITGSVSFHASGETQWSAATLNYPVTNGEAFWTEPQAQASLEIADDRVVLDSSTELDMGAIDVSQIVATEAQGAVFIHLNSLQPNQTVTFNTPRGAVQLTAPGRYEIVAGDTNDATSVTVVEGAAHITGTNLTLDVGPQQTATIGGTDTLQGSVGAYQQDAFLESMLRVPAPRHYAAAVPQGSAVAPPPQVQYMTGASDLDTYGSYTQSAEYGQVWYPHDVARDWAPYRDGHWAYVQPWGWTWVDNARWGFAPFHYGRWVQVENRWGWVPGAGAGGGVEVGVSSYPVYSPALVSFVGVGVGVSVGFSAGAYSPAWIPLGPREPYYPWYHTRGDYFARLNQPYGVPRTIIERGPTYNSFTNVNIHNTTIVNNTTINRQVFINQRYATVAPQAAFIGGRSLVGIARPVPVAALEHARPFVGRMPIAPTAQTPNLPPAAARRYNVALPAHPVGRTLPGPRIEARAFEPHAAPVLRQAAPPPGIHAVPASQVRAGGVAPNGVRPGEARPGEVRPALRNEAGRPVAPGGQVTPRDHGGLPALREPGARPGEVRGEAHPGGPEARRPGVETRQPAEARPGQNENGLHPAVRAQVPPTSPHAEAVRPQPRVDAARPEPSRTEAARPAPHGEARRPAPHEETARPAPHPEAARPAPRPEGARPAPHAEAPRPVRHEEAPRPAPRAEAPRPAPHAEAPRPAPHQEAPRPAPHQEAPRPAPHQEAPRPAHREEAPHPAPHPAPKKEEPKH